MRAHEFITEGEFHKSAREAIHGMQEFENTDNSPYMSYRFAVALAVAPGEMDAKGPVPGQRMVTLAYTPEEQDIINKAGKIVGSHPTTITNPNSKEMDHINTQSPMQPKGPIKRKS